MSAFTRGCPDFEDGLTSPANHAGYKDRYYTQKGEFNLTFMVVSINSWTLICYKAYYRDPKKVPVNVGNPHL